MTDRQYAAVVTDPSYPCEQIAAFFGPDRWRTPLPDFEHSGYDLVDQVHAWQPRFVVDVGCGHNHFQGKIDNLIGIDLVNPATDLVCDLLEAPIQPGSIDVILALGCLNFGTQDLIEQQIRHLASWLTSTGRIVKRANPGLPTRPGLPFFAWPPQHVDAIGAAAGLRHDGQIRYDTYRNSRGGDEPRLVWQYRPAGTAATAAATR
jgi:hypothetical protein